MPGLVGCACYEIYSLLFHHVFVDKLGHNGDGHSARTLTEDLSNVLVLGKEDSTIKAKHK